ncbi:hypothetical protein, partial [Dyella sp. C11]|uniref:hypothetical protein n=1 Tax=Dyella sp. C11 TaxID=2126991 RepID=UPI00271528C8
GALAASGGTAIWAVAVAGVQAEMVRTSLAYPEIQPLSPATSLAATAVMVGQAVAMAAVVALEEMAQRSRLVVHLAVAAA